jgi:hypothetical protein
MQEAAQHRQHRKELGEQFHSLLELGGASAQVTVLADSSSSSSITSSSSSSSSTGQNPGSHLALIGLPGKVWLILSVTRLEFSFNLLVGSALPVQDGPQQGISLLLGSWVILILCMELYNLLL